jgi:hypothetical protein
MNELMMMMMMMMMIRSTNPMYFIVRITDSSLGLFRFQGLKPLHLLSDVPGVFCPSVCIGREASGFGVKAFFPNIVAIYFDRIFYCFDICYSHLYLIY